MARLAHFMFMLSTCAAAIALPHHPIHFVMGSGSAQAANPMVELVSGGDVIGDGATPVRLHLVAFNGNGTQMNGATLKLMAQAGSMGKVSMTRAGLYAVDWTPPKVDAVSDVTLTIKGRSPDKQTISGTWSIAVHPSLDQQVSIAANPASLTLGQDGTSTLSITLSGGAQQKLDDVDMIVTTNSGTIDNVTHLGGGKFAAAYKPPSKFFPHMALITVADKRNPNRTYGQLAIPLVGKANFPVVGQPNSQVMVRIDDREFGPVPADNNGRAQVPLEVRPGFVEARVISVVNGKKTEEALDMQVPPANRVALFPTSTAIASDPTLTMPIRAFVTTPDGDPDTNARVKFTTTAGEVSKAKHEGNGVYRADFTPPFGNQGAAATLSVEADDLKSAQVASTTITLIPARPGTVLLTPEPGTLMKMAKGFQVLTKVQSADGVGMAGRELRFQANGAKANGVTQDLGSGDYKTRFEATGQGGVEVIATVRTEGSDNPFRKLLMFPSRDRLPSDGLSSSMLTILSLDEYGYPVGNVAVTLATVSGEGSLPAQATTDSSGMAQVHFTAGRKAGLARVSASTGGQATMIPLLLAPDKIAQGYSLPASGSASDIALYEAWRKIIQSARLEREGMVGIPIDGYGSSDSQIGPPTAITAIAEPDQIAPGGTVSVRMEAKDANGRGVGGQNLQVMASPGSVSAVTDQGGGRYVTNVTVPAGVTGTVKISAVISGVGVATTLQLPITAGSWAPVGTVDQGKTAEKEKPKRERKPKGDRPWLRAQAGVAIGGYHYHQEPTVLLGPIYDFPITFGGAETPSATAPGFALRGAMEVPGVSDNLGVRATFRSVLYRVELPEFEKPISDWLSQTSVVGVGRHTMELGDFVIQPGLRLGMGFDDFMAFQQSGTADRRTLDYGPLVVTALVTGPEVAVSWTDKVFGHVGMDFSFANFSSYYSFRLDMEVAYAFQDNLYGFVGSDVTRRSLAVYMPHEGEKQQVGVLEDHINLITFGLGWQM
jgi:hypothetical protein